MWRTLGYAAAGGVLLALLAYFDHQHFVRAYPTEIYGGLVAVVFTVVGALLGRRLARRRETADTPAGGRPAPPPGEPFAPDAARLRELAITPREHEILGLIAEGLSNREIGERLFVSENTVRTHASRLLGKLAARRRGEAVRKARELGLLP